MYFKTPQELVEFFNKLDLEQSTLVFKEGKKEGSCACNGSGKCQCPPKNIKEAKTTVHDASSKIVIESFSDNPEFELIIENTEENLFYVNDFEAIENACGTGKITIGDVTSFMNMCEMDNNATVNLNVVVESKPMYNMPFTLRKTDKEPYLVLGRDQLL